MIKPLAALAGAAALSVAAVPATAATIDLPPTTDVPPTTTVCGPSGLQAGLMTKVCAERTGDQVRLYGTVALAGPPSPGTPLPVRQDLVTTLTGGDPAGTLNRYVLFTGSAQAIGDVSGTVACDAPVRGGFAVSSYPWAPAPVRIDAVVPC